MRDDTGLALGKALDQAYAALSDSSFEEYAETVRQIERKFIEVDRERPRYALEVQRRVAEGLCHAAVRKNLPLSKCQELLKKLAALGYTDIGQEFTMVSVMARHFREKGDGTATQQLVHDFTAKLDELIKQANTFQSQLNRGLQGED